MSQVGDKNKTTY